MTVTCPTVRRELLLRSGGQGLFVDPTLDQDSLADKAEKDFFSYGGFLQQRSYEKRGVDFVKQSVFIRSEYGFSERAKITVSKKDISLTLHVFLETRAEKIRYDVFDRDGQEWAVVWRVSRRELFVVLFCLNTGETVELSPELSKTVDDEYTFIHYKFHWKNVIPSPNGRVFAVANEKGCVLFFRIDKTVKLIDTPVLRENRGMHWVDNTFVSGDRTVEID